MRQIKDLTVGSLRHHLLKLSLPIMGTSFIQMAYSLTDMAWLGRLGSKSVAAVGIISVLTWLANSIATINKTGSEVTVAHSLGKGDHEEAKIYAGHNFMMSLAIGIFLATLFWVFEQPILGIYLLEPEVQQLASEYLHIILTALPFVFMTNTMSGIYNASGISKIPFRILSLGLIMNMILDPLLIFVFKMGIAGAAWATFTCQTTVFVLFVYQLWIKDKLLGGIPLWIKPVGNINKRILHIGLPVAILNSLFVFVNMYLGRTASKVGGHIGIATLTTGGQMEAITWNTSQGVTTALSAVVAQNFGSKKIKRTFSAYKEAIRLTFVFGLIGTLLFIFLGEELFGIIVPDRDTYIAGGEYLRINGYSQLFMMAEITTQGFLYGIGRSMPPATISIIGNYARIPLAGLFISLGWGLAGIWWAISLTSIFKGFAAIGYYLYIKRKLVIKGFAE